MICLQGGAELTPGCRDMDAALLRRARGPVVVTALAAPTGPTYAAVSASGAQHFRDLGASDVVAAPDVRTQPEQALAALRSAGLLVLPGGSPARLLAALRDTAAGSVVAEVIAGVVAGGGAVMGASAGAMVLCAWTVLPDRPAADGGPSVVRGLGLVPGVAVLPHWSPEPARDDWVAAVSRAAPRGTTVLGLAEQSGVLVEGSAWTPVGRSAARLVVEQQDLRLGETWTQQTMEQTSAADGPLPAP